MVPGGPLFLLPTIFPTVEKTILGLQWGKTTAARSCPAARLSSAALMPQLTTCKNFKKTSKKLQKNFKKTSKKLQKKCRNDLQYRPLASILY